MAHWAFEEVSGLWAKVGGFVVRPFACVYCREAGLVLSTVCAVPARGVVVKK